MYIYYNNGFGVGFDGKGQPYNWFSHDLKIEVKENSGKSLYEKNYKGSVPGAHAGGTYSTGRTAGVYRGPVNYELVLESVKKWLRNDTL